MIRSNVHHKTDGNLFLVPSSPAKLVKKKTSGSVEKLPQYKSPKMPSESEGFLGFLNRHGKIHETLGHPPWWKNPNALKPGATALSRMFFPGSTEGKGGSFSQKPNLEVQVERKALRKNLPSGELTWQLKMAIYSGFSHLKW